MLSVIIPNYNHGSFLDRVVRSHLPGSRIDVEIVIVDDCSTDDSPAVIERLAATYPSVRFIRHAERAGPNLAIATGLASARGKFVRFAAADDFVEPGANAGAIESLDANPDAAFCFSDPSEYFPDTDRFRKVPLALSETPSYFSPSSFEAVLASNYFTISSNTVVYRRDAIASLGGFPPRFEWQADWIANLVLAFRHGVCYRPEALSHFSVNPSSYGSKGVRFKAGQRRLLSLYLSALEHEYQDVAPHFRRAALLPPEMRLHQVLWLASDPTGRGFLTPRLVLRLLRLETWAHLRPYTPMTIRKWLRRRAAAAERLPLTGKQQTQVGADPADGRAGKQYDVSASKVATRQGSK
jgi:glycosyltransferase involved in cell wall biosynthesis